MMNIISGLCLWVEGVVRAILNLFAYHLGTSDATGMLMLLALVCCILLFAMYTLWK